MTTSTAAQRRPPSRAVGGVGEVADAVEVALDRERGGVLLHAVEVRGEGLGLGVVGVEAEQLVVELPGPGRAVRVVEFAHRIEGSR